jgi:hypothetical protein
MESFSVEKNSVILEKVGFVSFFCWEKQCNTWESGHGGYKNTKVTTFLFLEFQQTHKNKMILAGSDFDENHLQV